MKSLWSEKVETPAGELLVAATSKGVCRICFPAENEGRPRKGGPDSRIQEDNRALLAAAAEGHRTLSHLRRCGCQVTYVRN